VTRLESRVVAKLVNRTTRRAPSCCRFHFDLTYSVIDVIDQPTEPAHLAACHLLDPPATAAA